MIKVYIAAPWAERTGLALEALKAVEKAGFEVCSRWILQHQATNEGDPATDPAMRALFEQEAEADFEDVLNADAFLLINSQARGSETSGKAVETGIALMAGMPVICVGKWSNVFHFLEGVTRVNTLEEGIECLKGLE